MPEGDTIFRAARTLDRALAGKVVTRFETVLPRLARVDDQTPLRGRTVERVRAAGKHLIIHFSGDLALRTHLRMKGSWHLYRAGERWRKRRDDMRLLIATDDFEAVGFNIPVAEFHSGRELARQDDLRRMGPDLLSDRFDLGEAIRRVRERGRGEIANVLLNQRIVAGIGNVYKSEVLFACGIDPFAPVDTLSDERIARIVTTARAMLQRNVHPGYHARRTTGRMHPAERLWVYGRSGEPCRKCDTPIEYRRQGPHARGTYWCPRCQA